MYATLSTDLLSSCAQLSLPTMVSLALNSLQEATLLTFLSPSLSALSLSLSTPSFFLSSLPYPLLLFLSPFHPPHPLFFSSNRNANSLPQHSVDVGDR